MPEENDKDPRERDYSTEELQHIMVQHMADLNDLSKSLCSSSVVAEIEAIGVKIKGEHFQDCPYYWRGADIQVIECSADSSMQDWENSITQVGWGHEEPCPSRFPIFLSGLINSIQEKAYYLEFNNKFFWYESIAKTCQKIELQNQNLSKSDLGRAVIFGQITATNKMKRWLVEDQNLSEISNLHSEGWRLYFGYGRNANPKAMLGADRAPSARKIMVDYLDDHRFVIDSKGYASVVKAPGEKVWGLIWAVSPEDFAQLDLREGVAIGSYKKTTCQTALIQALAGHDRDTKATVYISNRPLGRNAQPGYIEGIIEGLSAEGVPEAEYVHYLSFVLQASKKPSFEKKKVDNPTLPKNTEGTSPSGFMPRDPSLPFFAYGLFKQGELASEPLNNFKRFSEGAVCQNAFLIERDGMPLLITKAQTKVRDDIPPNAVGRVEGNLWEFNSEYAKEAYEFISSVEPENHYIWEELDIEKYETEEYETNNFEVTRANCLVARSPSVGFLFHSDSWSIFDDSFYGDVVEFCERTLAERANEAIPCQAAMLLLWSLLERIAALKYSLGATPMDKVRKIGSDKAFLQAIQSYEKKLNGENHPFRRILDTRSPNKKRTFRFSSPPVAMEYLYQLRNNITHRGKGGYEKDLPLILGALEILIQTAKNLLSRSP